MPLPVLVRNFEAGPTVFTDLATKDYVEWAGADDVNGGDVQVVPEAFFNNANFIRALQRGTFGVENPDESPELTERLEAYKKVDSLQRQRAVSDSRRTVSEDQANASIERIADNDQLVVPCVGPTRSSGINCNADVLVRSAQLNHEPPLCDKHAGYKREYVPEESWVDHKKVVSWTRFRLEQRQRGED